MSEKCGSGGVVLSCCFRIMCGFLVLHQSLLSLAAIIHMLIVLYMMVTLRCVPRLLSCEQHS